MFKNVTETSLYTALQDYHILRAMQGNYVTRFGQYFCNRFLQEGESWSELYYEEDERKAIDMIAAHMMGVGND